MSVSVDSELLIEAISNYVSNVNWEQFVERHHSLISASEFDMSPDDLLSLGSEDNEYQLGRFVADYNREVQRKEKEFSELMDNNKNDFLNEASRMISLAYEHESLNDIVGLYELHAISISLDSEHVFLRKNYALIPPTHLTSGMSKYILSSEEVASNFLRYAFFENNNSAYLTEWVEFLVPHVSSEKRKDIGDRFVTSVVNEYVSIVSNNVASLAQKHLCFSNTPPIDDFRKTFMSEFSFSSPRPVEQVAYTAKRRFEKLKTLGGEHWKEWFEKAMTYDSNYIPPSPIRAGLGSMELEANFKKACEEFRVTQNFQSTWLAIDSLSNKELMKAVNAVRNFFLKDYLDKSFKNSIEVVPAIKLKRI